MFVRFFIYFSSLVAVLFAKEATIEKLKLLDSNAKENAPFFAETSLSHLGVLYAQGKGKKEFCTAIHLAESALQTEKKCLEQLKKTGPIFLAYFDKAGKSHTDPIELASLIETNSDLYVANLPGKIQTEWPTPAKVESNEENWFGAFKPDWELVRVLGFVEGSAPNTVQFQSNTCKLSKKSPFLVYSLQSLKDKEDKDEVERISLAEEKVQEGKTFIEKCIRSMEGFNGGSIIAAAKNPLLIKGILSKVEMTAPTFRAPASAADKVLTQEYFGADGLEAPLPKGFPKVSLWLGTLLTEEPRK